MLKRALRKPIILYMLAGALIALLFVIVWYLFSFRPPLNFPVNRAVAISDGQSLSEIGRQLEEQDIINSRISFVNFVLLLKHENKVVGGQYYFERPVNVFEVARRVSQGQYNMDQLRTTIPEGSSVKEIAAIVKKNYPLFNDALFISTATVREGYLFPDTYLFGADARPEKIVGLLTSTFNKKIQEKAISDAIEAFGRPLKDVITMASILEGEARQTHTRKVVAGILWERIRVGMPLQVDATFKYINGKSTKDLTLDDLKIDSPYNTYVYRGLPPTPISNPGLDSIMAAVTPVKTKYLYFLTDDDGNMHYAETFEQHQINQNRYLD